MKQQNLPQLPEFSQKNFDIARYAVGTLITLSGLFFIYAVLFKGDLTFSAQWNIFKSPLGSVCIFIGFFWAMLWWGKFTHWSATPVIETRDRYTGKVIERKEDYDIMEQGFAKIIMPLLGHFVIEPIMYGCIIYYPIQCIIALVGSIFPYVLTLIVLGIIVAAWLLTKNLQFRYRSALLVVAGLLFTVAFTWGGTAIYNSAPGSTIQMLADTQTSSENVGVVQDNEEQTSSDESGDIVDEEEDEQFEGYGEEGLLGSLPYGTTEYEGDMEGYPIEFTIIKEEASDIKGIYKNVKYGTTMNLVGESHPADGGNISFFGKDGDTDWSFNLTGDVENITGTAQSGDTELKLTLHKK